MTAYSITAPDGTIYDVEAPEGATQEQVLAHVQSQHQGAQQPQMGQLQTIADNAAQGATFGLGDEIGAGFHGAAKYAGDKALLGADYINQQLGGQSWIPADKQAQVHQSLGENYNNQLAETRQNLQNEMQQRPVLSIGSNLAGALATGGLGAESAGGTAIANSLRTGGTWTRAGKSALVGAGSGLLYGLGQGEGGVGNRLESGGQGAVIGGILGGAIPVAGALAKGGSNAIGGLLNRTGALLGNEGAQENIANNIFAKRLIAEGYSPNDIPGLLNKGAASGLNPTLGEATGSSGILQAEKSVMRGTGKGANLMRDTLFERNRDTIPNTINSFADQLEQKAGDVSGLYKAASTEAGKVTGAGTIGDIKKSITSRLGEMGKVSNVESKSLQQADEIISNAAERGHGFDALLDAKKQLDNLFIEGADSATQKSASRFVTKFSNQINDTLKQLAPNSYPKALTAAKSKMAANDLREALNNTNDGSLATLYNKVWAKPELRDDFLRKLPDESTRQQATDLFNQLEKVKRGFGGSDTAFNLPANQQLSHDAGLGFDPSGFNPFHSIPTVLERVGRFAQPGVYNKMAQQSINPQSGPLLRAMELRLGNKPGLLSKIAQRAALTDGGGLLNQ